jgi:uncharacterized protein YdiU (UPF0061 family)
MTLFDEILSRVKTQLGGLNRLEVLEYFPESESPLDEIASAGLFDHIESREAYLDWVSDYKTLIKEIEKEIRTAKSKRRNPNPSVRSEAQCYASILATFATVLIRMRRLGKIWSQEQARQQANTVAA